MKRWLQPSVILALAGAVVMLAKECREWREQSWKLNSRIEFQEQWIGELRKESQ